MMLVSVAQCSADLRRDTTADDSDLELKIKAASRAIVTYLQDGADMFLTSAGEANEDSAGIVLDVPDDIKMATILQVREWYDGKERDRPDSQFGYGYLSNAVIALLYPWRTPVCL